MNALASGHVLHKKHPTTPMFRIILPVLLLAACSSGPQRIERKDFARFYEARQLEGAFALYDAQRNRWLLYNPEACAQALLPASTFKVCNSLIGIETGVIPDEKHLMRWDSVTRSIPAWNRDHDLQSAFRHSVVWYYQALARQVGSLRMKSWLDAAHYGNADTAGGIDKFWLTGGGLRISPLQQVDFLKRLHERQLPFSARTIDIVERIMVVEDTAGYVLRAKTGWGAQDGQEIGWYVGYLTRGEAVYYFANCLRTADPEHPGFLSARKDIALGILAELGILEH